MADGMAIICNETEVLLKDKSFLKIYSLSNATGALLSYAYSPRQYRRCLGRINFDVQRPCNTQGWISIPPPDGGWLNVSKQILARDKKESLLKGIEEDERPGYILEKRYKHQRSTIKIEAPVHCKCALALYLLKESRSGHPALPSIGVSKLSCLPCWSFLKALREAGHVLHTKECHSKTYFPGNIPIKRLSIQNCAETIETKF
ncbi:hypothetical protein EMCG_00030 [[Emmonsia] crescens]|uniref:Uncharacterized protein n=1 Tax=[Emmonsia] crescens TaxID=73230 RepID=A0A0G2J7Y7_9EURO|nr:hypothetical protein EMCG_00030 [Emmonsia crescens UAMH 3008]